MLRFSYMKRLSKPDSFLKGSVFITISQIVFLGVGYVLQVFFAKTLSANEYGILGTTLSALNIAELIFAAGILLNISSWIARAQERAGEILHAARRVQAALVAVLMAVLLIFAPFTDTLFQDDTFPLYFVLLAAFLPIYGVRAYYTSVLSGYKRFTSQFVYQFVATFVKLLAIPLVLLGWGVLGVLCSYVLSNAFLALFYFLQARRISIAKNIGTDASRRTTLRSFIVSVPPLTIFTFFFSAILSLDLFFVRALLDDTAQSGYYVGAGVVPRAILILFSGLMMVLVTFAAKPLRGAVLKSVNAQFQTMVSSIVLLMIPLTIFSIPVGSQVFAWLFRPEYASVGILAPFFLLAATALIIMRLLVVILVAQERFRALYPLLLLLLLDVGLLYVLVSSYGVFGAAIANTIVSLAGLVGYAVYCFRQFQISLPWRIIVKSLTSTVLVYSVAQLAFSGLFGLHFIWSYLVLFSAYTVILVLLRVTTLDDIRSFRESFSSAP